MRNKPIIAIDGPSGAGKTTVSRRVAETLGYIHVDTGALYRAVALAARRRGIGYDDDPALAQLLQDVEIRMERTDAGTRILLDGADVSEEIRSPEMSMGASAVSARAPVREGLLEVQRRLGGTGGTVLEGRDIATVVFPDAEVKIFLDASVEERARRRHEELQRRGETASREQVLEEVRQRDANDSSRALAPLKPAPDALRLDSTDLSIDEVVARVADAARAREA